MIKLGLSTYVLILNQIFRFVKGFQKKNVVNASKLKTLIVQKAYHTVVTGNQ